MSKSKLIQLFGVAAAVDLVGAAALAQNVALEEIVVTARRREENLMELPIAISSVSVDKIQASNIKDLPTLATFTPGLSIDTSLTNTLARNLNFRGLSTSNSAVLANSTVFVDGIALSGNGTPYLGALDRVEVLAGPQSVYFGRATFQGALNFVTKRPSDEVGGQLLAEYGSFNTYDVAFTLEGPLLGDKMAARVSARNYHGGGHWKNFSNSDQNMGWRQSRSLATNIYYNPSDDVTVKIFFDNELDDSGPPASIALKGNSLPAFGGNGTQIPGVTGGSQEIFCDTRGTFGVYYCGKLPSANGISPNIISGNFDITPYLAGIFFENRIQLPTHFDPRFLQHTGGKALANMAHFTVDWDMPADWAFSATIAYHHTKQQSFNSPNYRDTRDVRNPQVNLPIPAGQPCCRLPYISFHLMQQDVREDWDYEFRIESPQDERLRGTIGASYLFQTSPGPSNLGQTKTVPAYLGSLTAQDVKTPAVYGGLYYDLTEELTLTGEARYQRDKVIATTTFPTPRPPTIDTYNSFSPRVSIDYNYAPDSIAFALFSRGYRRGGFNAILVGQPASVLQQLAPIGAGERFGQERLDNAELGLKSTWLDGAARTRLVGYYQWYRNGQVSSTISFVQPNGIVVNTAVITNGGKVDLYGFEFEGDWIVNDNLSVNATFNWQPSDISSYNYVPVGVQIRRSGDISGNSFWGAPVIKWTISPKYTAPLSGDWEWFAAMDYKY
ncbi:MAG: hypothetical protein FJX59_20050, partial [Alphaproteobacteria bacterium]|nr:hypothetical protein [Alphaproteobacteria bacterium]